MALRYCWSRNALSRFTLTGSPRDGLTAGSSPEDELTPAPPGLFRYHAGGNMVLGAGVATGLLFAGLNWLPAWGGFLVGAVPTLLLCRTFPHAPR